MQSKWHPSYEDLALYAECAESRSGWAELESHVGRCSECYAAVAMHRMLLDDEKLAGEESPITDMDTSQQLRSGKNESQPFTATPDAAEEEAASGFSGWIMGLAGGLGLGGFGHPAPMPALGRDAGRQHEHVLEPHDLRDPLHGGPDISPGTGHETHDWAHESGAPDDVDGSNGFNSNGLLDDGEHGHHG